MTHTRLVTGALLMTAVLASAACPDRLAELEGWHVCTYVTAARVYDEQGNPVAMVLHDGGNSEICLCLTPEDVKSGEYDQWFNDQAYLACLEDAALMGYPDAHDCDYWHDDGQWIINIRADIDYVDIRCDPDPPF